jgi:uncharacterized protein DUF3667
MSHVAPASDACYNCAAPLAGAYCAVCGQKALPLNPGLHDVLHDVTHEMRHVDGKIFQSVWKLLAAPGLLTRDQFEGRRARWISPLHVHAAWFGAGAIAAAAALVSWPFFAQAVPVLALAYAGIYVVLALRTAYGGTAWQTFGRAVVVVGLYWIAVIVATMGIVLPVVLRRLL